jgi:type II secretion system protein J
LNNRGFTLLELLISITMLALIASIAGGALSMTNRSLEKGEKKIHHLEALKASFSLVEAQVQSAFPSQYDDQGEKKILFSGQKDKLSFSTNYSIWRGTRGNAVVSYDIRISDQGKESLRVQENVRGLEARSETILFTGCDHIFFEYYLHNTLEEGKWVDQWPAEETGLPGKIRINIASGKTRTALVVNILTKPAAALASAANMPTVSR